MSSSASSSTLTPISWFSEEEEEEKYKKRLADKSQPYYYGYDIEKDADEIVYPILFDTRNRPLSFSLS
jgi:hypothetical protein